MSSPLLLEEPPNYILVSTLKCNACKWARLGSLENNCLQPQLSPAGLSTEW